MAVCIVSPKAYLVLDEKQRKTFGGAEVQLTLLAKEMAKKGIEVDLIVGDYGQPYVITEDKLNIFKTIKSGKELKPRGIVRLGFAIWKSKAEVVIQRTLSPLTFFVAINSRLAGKRFVYMVAHDSETDKTHPIYRNPVGRLVAVLSFRIANIIIVQNEQEKEALHQWVPTAETAILKKGIEHHQISDNGSKKYDAVWVGRCEDWKNPDSFIRLARGMPDLRFAMVCPPATGKQHSYQMLHDEVESVPNLTFFERLPNQEIHELLTTTKAYVITSTKEGDWPMSVLEAAANGVPIISLNIDYGKLTEEYHGACTCQGDETRMQWSLLTIVKDEQLWKQMSEGSWRYANDHHDLAKQTEVLLKYIGIFRTE